MHFKKHSIFLGITLLIGLVAFSGTYLYSVNNSIKKSQPVLKEEYQHLAKRLASLIDSSVQVEGEIYLYDGEKPDVIKEKSNFFFIKHGNSYYSQMSHQQTFCNGIFIVLVDSLNKQIIVSKAVDTATAASSGNMLFNKLLTDTSALSISGEVTDSENGRQLVINDDNMPEIKSYTIDYNASTYIVNTAEIVWWKNPLHAQSKDEEQKVWLTKMLYKYTRKSSIAIDMKLQEILVFKDDNQIELQGAYRYYQIHKLF